MPGRLALLLSLLPLTGCHLMLPLQRPGDSAAVIDSAPDAARPVIDTGGDGDLARDLDAAGDGDALDQSPAAKTCAALYAASVPSFTLCGVSDAGYTFGYGADAAVSCNTLCGSSGICLEMMDNVAQPCEVEAANYCTTEPCHCGSQMFNAICTCSR